MEVKILRLVCKGSPHSTTSQLFRIHRFPALTQEQVVVEDLDISLVLLFTRFFVLSMS